jgi:hypothetical protein
MAAILGDSLPTFDFLKSLVAKGLSALARVRGNS